MSCHECGTEVQEEWLVCPVCKTSLEKKICPLCNRELELEWTVCPFCPTQSGTSQDVQPDQPTQSENTSISGNGVVPSQPSQPESNPLMSNTARIIAFGLYIVLGWMVPLFLFEVAPDLMSRICFAWFLLFHLPYFTYENKSYANRKLMKTSLMYPSGVKTCQHCGTGNHVTSKVCGMCKQRMP